MKRFLTTLGAALVLTSSGAFAEQQTLIDFSKLVGSGAANLHAPTTIDYSRQAGGSYSTEDKANMKVSLAIDSWEVQLASSAQTVANQSQTQIKSAPVKSGGVVLGARIHFPEFAINSWAMIKPPFTIPAFATLEGDQNAVAGNQFVNYGVVKNVGTIKSIQINVLGRNYPVTLSIVLENNLGEQQEISMGSLAFDGWQPLTWNNPDYQTEVRDRELKVNPLYPKVQPFIKLVGIRLHHDGSTEGGDFVTYIKDISVIFDQANVGNASDVDDEALWSIQSDREAKARQAELKTLGAAQVLRAIEKKKLAAESFDTAATTSTGTATAPAASTAAPAAAN